MTNAHRNAITDLVKDVILDLLDDAPEERLIEVYTILKGARPHEPVVNRQTPIPPAPRMPTIPSESGEYPAATIAVTARALSRLPAPAKLAQVVDEVHREQPAISKASIAGALGRLVQAGEVQRKGETRASVYALRSASR